MSSRKSWINRKRSVVNMAARVVHLQWHLAPISVPCIEAVDSSRHYSCAFLLASVLSFFFFPFSKNKPHRNSDSTLHRRRQRAPTYDLFYFLSILNKNKDFKSRHHPLLLQKLPITVLPNLVKNI